MLKSLRTNRSFLCASAFFSLTTNINPNPMTSCACGRNCLSACATCVTPGGSASPATGEILLTRSELVHHADLTAREFQALLRHITAAPACTSEYAGTARTSTPGGGFTKVTGACGTSACTNASPGSMYRVMSISACVASFA